MRVRPRKSVGLTYVALAVSLSHVVVSTGSLCKCVLLLCILEEERRGRRERAQKREREMRDEDERRDK